jgi:hypothetical protein
LRPCVGERRDDEGVLNSFILTHGRGTDKLNLRVALAGEPQKFGYVARHMAAGGKKQRLYDDSPRKSARSRFFFQPPKRPPKRRGRYLRRLGKSADRVAECGSRELKISKRAG